MGGIGEALFILGLLIWAGLVGAVVLVPVLVVFVWRQDVVEHTVVQTRLAILLVVRDSVLFQEIYQSSQALFVARVKSVPAELLELSVGHLLGLLYLLRVQLHLGRVDSIAAGGWGEIGLLGGFCVAVVIVIIIILLGHLLAACLSVLLGNAGLQLVDCALLQLFPHLRLLAEPCLLLVCFGVCGVGALSASRLLVDDSHFEHEVAEVFVRIVVVGLALFALLVGLLFVLLGFHVHILVVVTGHVLLYEFLNGLAKADFVVETGGAHDGRGLLAVALDDLDARLALGHVSELSDVDLFDVRVTSCVLEDDQLVGYDSVSYFLFLCRLQHEGFGDLVHLDVAAIAQVLQLVEDRGHI